jgi:hypothetical protein
MTCVVLIKGRGSPHIRVSSGRALLLLLLADCRRTARHPGRGRRRRRRLLRLKLLTLPLDSDQALRDCQLLIFDGEWCCRA